MATAGFLAAWIALGVAVLFVAFSGGPGKAREAYLTRGSKPLRIIAPVLFIGLGIAIPALVIADTEEGTGGSGRLASAEPDARVERGKVLFQQTCASCHTLRAINARGVTGPNLDEIGAVNQARVLGAIRNGGTGQDRMPAGLLDGEDAEAVAAFVSRVAGK